ncbi:MAG: protein jag [Armatimonadota bacterium]
MEPEETEGEYTAADSARDFVLDVIDAMGLVDADVEVATTEEGSLLVSVVGEGADRVVGRYGDTLNALQYLATLVVTRDTGEHVRLTLDADGYRGRREAALIEQARELAEEVKQHGQEAELDPLNAFERRIIHNALADDPDVTTYSEGEGDDRRVIIAPRVSEG